MLTYNQRHPEKARAYRKKWELQNPEKYKAAKVRAIANWRAKNKDKIKEYSKKYYKQNRTDIISSVITWSAENPDKVKEYAKRSKAKLRYDLSSEEYAIKLAQAAGICEACGRREKAVYKGLLKNLSFDHDHKTGKVRGVICSGCNHALGLLDDNVEILRKLTIYLEKYK